MSGWREPSAPSRPTYHQHASASAIHDATSNAPLPSGLTISHSSPALHVSNWDDTPQPHSHHYHLTSSSSSPSLVFDHGMAGQVDSNNSSGFTSYNNGSTSTSSSGYRSAAGYPGYTLSKPAYGSSSASLSSLSSSSQAAAAMYHQQPGPNAPYSHYSTSVAGGPTNAVAPASNGMSEAGLPEQKVLASHDRPHHGNGYTSSSAPPPLPSQHHFHQHQSHHASSSPTVNDYNGDYRSSHASHPFEVKHRRRTTRTQFKVLEATFRENPKPNASVRKSVSQQLDMPVRAVQIWFQNRRAKAKAVAKREAGQSGDLEQDDDDYADQSHFIDTAEDDDGGRRYSSSPTSFIRPSVSGPIDGTTGLGGYTTPVSASSDTFKLPNRPLRIDTEASNRRMTTGAMPSSASGGFTGNSFYHSPPLSSSASLPYSSHLSNSSPSLDGANNSVYTRPSSHSFSTSAVSASYDDRYRRGAMTSPGVLQHDSIHMSYPAMTSHRQAHYQPFHPLPSPHNNNNHQSQSQSHQQQQYHQQQSHHNHTQQMGSNLPSAFDPETRRLSLPENIPSDPQLQGNLSLMQQQQQQQSHHHAQQQYNQHNHRSTVEDTNYWRY